MAYEKQKRQAQRREMISEEYAAYLWGVTPQAIAFLPTANTLMHYPALAHIVDEDREPDDKMRVATRDALDSASTDLLRWLSKREQFFRSILPTSWSQSTEHGELDTTPTSPLFQTIPSWLAPFDLAVNVFACKHKPTGRGFAAIQSLYHPCRYRIFSGLEALAHQCPKETAYGFEENLTHAGILPLDPMPLLHEDVCDMLQLLGFDPAHTTPHDLDQVDRHFI